MNTESVGPCALYVYYRVRHERATEALAVVSRFQSRLRSAWPEVRTRLLQRTDEAHRHAEGESTWMEVYEHPQALPPGVEQAVQALLEDVPDGLMGPRHVESFCPLTPSTAPLSS